MAGLLEQLTTEPLLLADGAWGSYFIHQGLDVTREPADAWNLRHPEIVTRLAVEYLVSGARILTTNTFGANRNRLARFGLDRDLQEINARSVTLLRNAIHHSRKPALIAGSMGPSRGPGTTQPDDSALFDACHEQAACLAGAGVDFLLLETITDLDEACIALRAARDACDLDVVCSFAFREIAPGQFETWCGTPVPVALNAVRDAGADLVGANCIPPSASIFLLVETLRHWAGSESLWLKPNAGVPDLGAKPPTYPQSLRDAPLKDLCAALGTGVIGGCCGSTPDDIGCLRTALGRQTESL